jgi:hypothetical protein
MVDLKFDTFAWDFLSKVWDPEKCTMDANSMKNIMVTLNTIDAEAVQNFMAKTISKGPIRSRLASLELFLAAWTLYSTSSGHILD